MSGIKRLFSTPKKAALTLACAGVMLVTLGVCVMVCAAGGPERSRAIGGERAQNFAFADAGVDPVEARSVKVKYEQFQEGFVYEVEFTAGDTEYEYKIDAEDGSVVKRESRTVKAAGTDAPPLIPLTLEEARAIALADAGLTAGQAVFTEAEEDTENGAPVYEFEFRAGDTEYRYEINAHTGSVYSKGVVTYVSQPPAPSAPAQSAPPAQTAAPDPRPDQTPVPSQAPAPSAPAQSQQTEGRTYIGLDAAKRAALADAGVDSSQVYFTKAELDYEDGVPVYELEFCTDTHEHEYEIHARTGAVCGHSVGACPHSGGHHSSGHHSDRHHSAPQGSGAVLIGLDAAKSAALTHADCQAGQVTFTKTELDDEDGRAVYEIEFRKDRTEYEYEIDAATGEVLKYEWEQG
ncbi:MAG: hypothetical protein HDT38_03385 [Clostridiales bacterium]|nr:hypothetical protein [Clostridiales bacterium]